MEDEVSNDHTHWVNSTKSFLPDVGKEVIAYWEGGEKPKRMVLRSFKTSTGEVLAWREPGDFNPPPLLYGRDDPTHWATIEGSLYSFQMSTSIKLPSSHGEPRMDEVKWERFDEAMPKADKEILVWKDGRVYTGRLLGDRQIQVDDGSQTPEFWMYAPEAPKWNAALERKRSNNDKFVYSVLSHKLVI